MSAPGDHLVDAVRALGHRPVGVLGAGMEGTVVDLGDGQVLKVWASRTAADLRRLRAFYDSVHDAGFPFGVPRILDVLEVAGQQATVQVRLDGDPLWDRPGVSPPPDDAHLTALLEILQALADVEPTAEMAVLPVLDGEAPFDPAVPFGRSLARLVERRVARSEAVLGARLPHLPELVAAVTSKLEGLTTASPGLVHGDLVPGNVLLSGAAPAGVLDFGFLSTVGDPAFDAAVTASIFDMYGADATRSEARVDRAVADRFGYDGTRIWAYRAAYALVTATCFSASGSDGHFDWCVRMLERPELRAAVDL